MDFHQRSCGLKTLHTNIKFNNRLTKNLSNTMECTTIGLNSSILRELKIDHVNTRAYLNFPKTNSEVFRASIDT